MILHFLWSLCIQENGHCDALSCSWSSMCDLTILKPCCDSYAYMTWMKFLFILKLWFFELLCWEEILMLLKVVWFHLSLNHVICTLSILFRLVRELCKWRASLPDMLWYLSVVINLNGSHMGNHNICNWSQNLKSSEMKMVRLQHLSFADKFVAWQKSSIFLP